MSKIIKIKPLLSNQSIVLQFRVPVVQISEKNLTQAKLKCYIETYKYLEHKIHLYNTNMQYNLNLKAMDHRFSIYEKIKLDLHQVISNKLKLEIKIKFAIGSVSPQIQTFGSRHKCFYLLFRTLNDVNYIVSPWIRAGSPRPVVVFYGNVWD